MKPIYKPSGRALEYSPDALACNLYTGCPHRCFYCYSPSVLRKDKEAFHTDVAPRAGIITALKKQLLSGTVSYYETVINGPVETNERRTIALSGKLIHLCFTCDPYPAGYDTSVTREAIKAIKEAGCHVQILTKGGTEAERDFDLLDGDDWFGVTITGGYVESEPGAAPEADRVANLRKAKGRGISTWVSFEPVINPYAVYLSIAERGEYIDLFRIGKLNYHQSDIDWATFGQECERLCKVYNRKYYIKADLRAEMEKERGSLQ